MKVFVDQIPDDGLVVTLDGDEPWAIKAVHEAVGGEVISAGGQLFIRVNGEDLRVNGQLKASLKHDCERCAQRVDVELVGDVELAYVPEGSRDGESRELHKDDCDLGFYPPGALDLAVVLQEYFALNLPARLACDVPGVSPVDGSPCHPATLDLETEKTVDPRFAALADLKLDN